MTKWSTMRGRSLIVLPLLPFLAYTTMAQVNTDSLQQLLAHEREPLQRLLLLKQLTHDPDPDAAAGYAHTMVVLADSLIGRDAEHNKEVLGLKADGLWNYAVMRYERSQHRDPDSALLLYGKAAEIWKAIGDREGMAFAASTIATDLLDLGRPKEALERYQECLDQLEGSSDTMAVIITHAGIGGAYYFMGDHPRALEHYGRVLELAHTREQAIQKAFALQNMAGIYQELGQPDTALSYFQRNIEVNKTYGLLMGKEAAVTNAAKILSDRGEYAEALRICTEALSEFDKEHWPDAVSTIHSTLADIYRALADADQALYHDELAAAVAEHAQRSSRKVAAFIQLGRTYYARKEYRRALDQAMRVQRTADSLEIGLASGMDLALLLADIYSATGQAPKALMQYRKYETLKDSLNSDELRKKIRVMDLRKQALADSLKSETQRHALVLAHEREMAAEQNRKRVFMFGGLGVLLLAGGLWNRLRFVRRSRAIIQKERDRSEELLLNILPAEVAEELKVKGEAEAVHIDQVTVLFTDFKGFTAMSEKVTPKELVHDLHECFSAFDRITEKYGIEKIKTIGDAYMAAGGLPTPNTTHATDVIKAAFEMRDFIAEGKARKIAEGLPYFEIRIGIHTGPVVAGIVGVKKFQYDIWGDTVNTASRMESSGEVGQMNISESTYALVKDEPGFTFTPRGKVQAKGKGEMEMYFVEAT